MGLPGPHPNGYRDFSYAPSAEQRADVSRVAAVTERADVVIVGSGFGGSITAWRLAELYRAAGVDPSAIVVLERGRRYGHTDFRQSTDIDHLSDVYLLIQGQGAQVVTANAVGGGSNLYLAASLRSPQRDLRAARSPPRRWSGAPDVAGRDLARRCSIRTTRAPSSGCG